MGVAFRGRRNGRWTELDARPQAFVEVVDGVGQFAALVADDGCLGRLEPRPAPDGAQDGGDAGRQVEAQRARLGDHAACLTASAPAFAIVAAMRSAASAAGPAVDRRAPARDGRCADGTVMVLVLVAVLASLEGADALVEQHDGPRQDLAAP
jgi:hypothetical protein